MAKKSNAESHAAERTKPRGRPKSANPKGRTPIVMTIRAGSDWEEWMDEACETIKQRTGLGKVERTDAFDVAMKDMANNLGLRPPPARY